MTNGEPPFGQQIWFWVILGMLSTYIAEVTVGSAPFPFFDPFGIMVVVPLYTLHILVLGTVVVRGRKVTLTSLFVGGIIFGLYEAYITKVIWNPHWEFMITVHLADVAVVQTALLVLWYHNFFAFIIPLAVAEIYCSRSRKVFSALPRIIRIRFTDDRAVRTLIIFGVAFGVLQATSSHGPLISLVSVGTGGLLVFGLCHMFKTRVGARYSIDELLPDPGQFRIILALLLMFYAIFTPLLLPENLPGPLGHIAVAAMYLGAFLLLHRILLMNGMDDSEPSISPHADAAVNLSKDRILLFLAVYVAAATLMGFVPTLAAVFTVCIHVAGIFIGVNLLVISIQSCIRLN